MDLLKQLCAIASPSGDEGPMRDFILEYVRRHSDSWAVTPRIIADDTLQDGVLLVFGTPRTAVFAHMDTVGFTAAYDDRLVRIGGPAAVDGALLAGADDSGPVECRLTVISGRRGAPDDLRYRCERPIERGTPLSYKPDFRDEGDWITCSALDNRVGLWNALRLAETLRDGAIAFSTYEEAGGGTVGVLAERLWREFGVRQALISDVTWATEGVHFGEGVAVSMRDSGIPRRSWLRRIVAFVRESGVSFQLEVESAGGSDGNQLQRSPFPFDWCFIGPPSDGVHGPDERVHRGDVMAMRDLYRYLMERL